MIYSIEEYASKFFNGNKAAMARYHGVKVGAGQRVTKWINAGDMFAVIEDQHIRFNPKNMVTFNEGVKR